MLERYWAAAKRSEFLKKHGLEAVALTDHWAPGRLKSIDANYVRGLAFVVVLRKMRTLPIQDISFFSREESALWESAVRERMSGPDPAPSAAYVPIGTCNVTGEMLYESPEDKSVFVLDEIKGWGAERAIANSIEDFYEKVCESLATSSRGLIYWEDNAAFEQLLR